MEYEKYKILYITDIYGIDKRNLKIFDKNFIQRNKNKCKLIINNKKDLRYNLNAEEIIKKKSNMLKIKLIIYKYIVDLSFMFKDCKALWKILDENADKDNNNEYIEKSEISQIEKIIEFKDNNIYNNDKINDIYDNEENNEENNSLYKNIYSYDDITEISTIKAKSSYKFDNKSIMNINDIIETNLEKEKPIYIKGIFYNCPYLLSFPFNSKIKYKVINEMDKAFCNCQKLEILPHLSNLNTENVTSMIYIFAHCVSLTSLPGISDWNTKNVTNMQGMFLCCFALTIDSIKDIGKWNTVMLMI